jgi:hypothetical protein
VIPAVIRSGDYRSAAVEAFPWACAGHALANPLAVEIRSPGLELAGFRLRTAGTEWKGQQKKQGASTDSIDGIAGRLPVKVVLMSAPDDESDAPEEDGEGENSNQNRSEYTHFRPLSEQIDETD